MKEVVDIVIGDSVPGIAGKYFRVRLSDADKGYDKYFAFTVDGAATLKKGIELLEERLTEVLCGDEQ